MAVSAINGIQAGGIVTGFDNKPKIQTNNKAAFDQLLSSYMNMYGETNALQKAAEQAELEFALGYSDNTHDLAIAQQKANIALQYTVKVTNKTLEAYKELMNMQI